MPAFEYTYVGYLLYPREEYDDFYGGYHTFTPNIIPTPAQRNLLTSFLESCEFEYGVESNGDIILSEEELERIQDSMIGVYARNKALTSFFKAVRSIPNTGSKNKFINNRLYRYKKG